MTNLFSMLIARSNSRAMRIVCGFSPFVFLFEFMYRQQAPFYRRSQPRVFGLGDVVSSEGCDNSVVRILDRPARVINDTTGRVCGYEWA
jgi:hypothetical protein